MTRSRLAFVFGSSFCLASLPSLVFVGAHQSVVRKPQNDGQVRADNSFSLDMGAGYITSMTSMTSNDEIDSMRFRVVYPLRQEMKQRRLKPVTKPMVFSAQMQPYLSVRHRSQVRKPVQPQVRLRYTTVQFGDTLWGISRRYGVPLNALEQWNHLSVESLLQIGQRIQLSQTETVRVTHAQSALTGRSLAPEPSPVKVSGLSSRSETTIGNLSSGLLGAQIGSYAQLYLGVPYRWAGDSPISGFDCSGLVQFVLAHFGIQVGRSSYEQFVEGTPVYRYDLLPGDLVFFDSGGPGPSHVGIFLGGNRFISASGTSVRVTSLAQAYWTRHYIGARRIRSQYAA